VAAIGHAQVLPSAVSPAHAFYFHPANGSLPIRRTLRCRDFFALVPERQYCCIHRERLMML
jgi:hypothetical protein